MSGKITGIGGIFIAVKDREKMKKWYHDVLGLTIGEFGCQFLAEDDPKREDSYGVFTHFDADSDYLKPGTAPFMLNFRVDNLDAFVATLEGKDVALVGDIIDEPYGKFAWIIDPEGLKIELWEQKDGVLER